MNHNAILNKYIQAKTQGERDYFANMLIRDIMLNPKTPQWTFDIFDESEEIWMAPSGFEGLYEVSNLGRLRRLMNGKVIISVFHSKSGNYLHTYLRKDGIRHRISIHIEVAKLFVPNPDSKPFVNHLDGYKDNPRWDNLEWSTTQENNIHARKIGLNNTKGQNNWNTKLTDEQVLFIFNSKLNNVELGKMFGVEPTSCSGIKCGKSWSHLTGKEYKRSWINPDLALEIFNSKLPYKEMQIKYGVPCSTINNIKAGVSWSNATGKISEKRKQYVKRCNLVEK